ncbi:hypothetical protein HZS_6633 [Henneguya salminicola]|nr:hypothetical protein HZS_6633 [Henneguya salminicola]
MKITPRNRTNSLDENGQITEPIIDDFLAEFQWRRNIYCFSIIKMNNK